MNGRIPIFLALIFMIMIPATSAQHPHRPMRDEMRIIDFRIIGGRAFSPNYAYTLAPERNRIIPRGDNVYELELVFINTNPDNLLRNQDIHSIKIFITLYYDGRQFIFFTNAHSNKIQPWDIKTRETINDRGTIGMERTIRFRQYRSQREYERGGNNYEPGAGDLRIVFDGHY